MITFNKLIGMCSNDTSVLTIALQMFLYFYYLLVNTDVSLLHMAIKCFYIFINFYCNVKHK